MIENRLDVLSRYGDGIGHYQVSTVSGEVQTVLLQDSDSIDSDGLSWDNDYFTGNGPLSNSAFRQNYVDWGKGNTNWGKGNTNNVLDQLCLAFHQPQALSINVQFGRFGIRAYGAVICVFIGSRILRGNG